MVLLHVKETEDKDQFLYEVPADTVVEEVMRQIIAISNLRRKIQRLKACIDELAAHGPVSEHASHDAKGRATDMEGKGVQWASQDPAAPCTGATCTSEQAGRLQRALAEADQAQSKDQVARKLPLTGDMLEDAIDGIRTAVAEAYPNGAPEHDSVWQTLDDTEDLTGTEWEELQLEHAELWFANRKLPAGNKLSQHVGRNEKTKAIVKLQKAGWGRPPREPTLDEETEKAVLAYYHRKQQEQERLAEDDTHHYDAAWANPRALKQHFHGIGSVRLA